MLLFVILVLQVYQPVLGEVVQNEWVYEGAVYAQLSCMIPGGFNDITYVVWSRSDLDPTTIQQSGVNNVLNPCYSSRTKMSADFYGLFYRDLSLTLNKPGLFDSGMYTCTVHSTLHGVLKRYVKLQVTKPGTLIIDIRVVPVVFLVVALLVCVALGVAGYIWENTILRSKVEVNEGECSVELPFKTIIRFPKTSVKFPGDVTVEWSRCSPEPMKAHVYNITSSHIIDQNQIYRGRTSMKKVVLTSEGYKDLSLTLKDPCYGDSGTYICTVQREQAVLAQKVVQLKVKAAQVELEIGDWSKTFMLPFLTSAQLPEDATVEWMRSEPMNMTVHVFENGKDQPYKQDECYHGKTRMNSDPLRCRDLSVTVHNSGYSDEGTYICTVRREGHILAQRRVVLRVRDLTIVDVEVDWTAQTAKLPWFITANLPEHASVEWNRHGFTKVHVFEDGQNQSCQGRTTMRKNPLQSGDLSLTLKNPTIGDNGIYHCVVTVNSELVWKREVRLKVKGQ